MEEGNETKFHFPAGFRFHPTDEELIVYYLQPKVTSRHIPPTVIADIDLYKFHPWELPQKALFGKDEFYFFSPRDRKYPNGFRPNRAAASGYWKATGTDKAILTSSGSKIIGVKKALVFYVGRPPTKTDWMMDEYRLPETMIRPSSSKRTMRLDNWVLCRVRQKANTTKNIQRVNDLPKPETMRQLMQVEDSIPTENGIMFEDNIYKHCPVLTSLLTGQLLPILENKQSASPQEIYNNCYEDGSCSDTSPMTVTKFGSFLSPLICRSEIQESSQGNPIQSKNMITEMHLCSDVYYEADIFTPSPSSMDMTPECVLHDGYLL